MPKLKITPATADTLHEYALSLGYRDVLIPPGARYERYRIQSAESYEAGSNEYIFFYFNERGVVTLYGHGAAKLYAAFLEGADD